jgi:hypothetical protein
VAWGLKPDVIIMLSVGREGVELRGQQVKALLTKGESVWY